jgi:hypothetical protein
MLKFNAAETISAISCTETKITISAMGTIFKIRTAIIFIATDTLVTELRLQKMTTVKTIIHSAAIENIGTVINIAAIKTKIDVFAPINVIGIVGVLAFEPVIKNHRTLFLKSLIILKKAHGSYLLTKPFI